MMDHMRNILPADKRMDMRINTLPFMKKQFLERFKESSSLGMAGI
jgi:hypothetical protein